MVICGPSGSGKSTLIRCINRLEEHQKGQILVNGIEMNDNVRNISRIRLSIGMLFQQFNLFPHLSVLDNLIIGPTLVRKMTRPQATELAMHYLEKVHIANRAHTSSRCNCPVGNSSVWRLPAPCVCSRKSCCLMSRRRRSIRK